MKLHITTFLERSEASEAFLWEKNNTLALPERQWAITVKTFSESTNYLSVTLNRFLRFGTYLF